MRRPRLTVALLALALLTEPVVSRAAPAPGPARSARSADYLKAILRLSPAPEYRRAGSHGMEQVAAFGAWTLARDGYRVVREDFPLTRWAVDYSAGHEPLVQRLSDGRRFKTDSAFNLGTVTGPDGVTCTVRAIADVKPGDCGFVPFAKGSPQWDNALQYDPKAAVAQIKAQGGVAAVVQGDVNRGLRYALQLKGAIPTVVSVVPESSIVGQRFRIRTMGRFEAATGRNVIAVIRPPAGSTQYVLLLAHADGWFQAAADNGGGAAAVLRAAQQLAEHRPGIGVIVGLMDGEEIGLLGSKAFTGALSSAGGIPVGDGGPSLRLDDIKAVVNIDASSARASDAQYYPRTATGRDAPLFNWRILVTSEEPALTALSHAVFAAHQVLSAPITAGGAIAIEGSLRSDVAWFQKAGIPFVWPAVGYPEYHTDGDGLGAVDPTDLEHLADAAVDMTGRIAATPIGRIPVQFRQ